MMPGLSDDLLRRFNAFLTTHVGLHFADDRLRDLERGLISAATAFDYPTAAACVQGLMAAPLSQSQIEKLATHLTVGETYFFREKSTMDALQSHILPELIRARRDGERRIKIWSAGCCTGEEPYTLALMLSQLIGDLSSWNITILATDINPRSLRKAEAGIYNEWSFRTVPPAIRERLFIRSGRDRFEVPPDVRRLVTFSYLNLADDIYPSPINHTQGLDLILCQNVLMYLTDAVAQRAADNFRRCLVEDGWFFVTPAETASLNLSDYSPVNFKGATFYRKQTRSHPEILEESLEADELAVPAFFPDPIPAESDPEPEPLLEVISGDQAVADEPDLTPSFIERARASANQGHLQDALYWSRQALGADKLSVAAGYLEATILEEQAAWTEAMAAYKRVLFLDPQFVLAHFALENLSRRQGRMREAERHWKNCLQLLRNYAPDDVLPQSDGVTAGRLMTFLKQMRSDEDVVSR